MYIHREQGRRVQREDNTADHLRLHEKEGAQLLLHAGPHPDHRVRRHPRPKVQPHHLPLHKLHERHRIHPHTQRQGVQGHRRGGKRHVPHGRPPHAPPVHHHPRSDIRGRNHLQPPGPPLVVRTVRGGRDEGDMGGHVGPAEHVLGHK